jgi:hypothetical protein
MHKPSGPRGGEPTYPCSRYQKLQILGRNCHLAQASQAGQKTQEPARPLRHLIGNQIDDPSFQPHSLRGVMSSPMDVETLECSQQQHLAIDSYIITPNTTTTSTDARMPSSTRNNALLNRQKLSQNMSLLMKRTRPRRQFNDADDLQVNVFPLEITSRNTKMPKYKVFKNLFSRY